MIFVYPFPPIPTTSFPFQFPALGNLRLYSNSHLFPKSIGHTRLTHSYLLSGDDLPECGTCQCPLTVKHILVDCVDLKDVRNKHFVASSIKDLFDSIEAHKSLILLKKLVSISNFNVFILMFVILFFILA